MEIGEDASTAVIFPGISPSNFTRVARFLLINPVARELTSVAGDTLNYPLVQRYREADGDYSEPERVAFLVSCVALERWARDALGVRAGICAGPSFGGTPAAVCSGALSFPDAVTLIARMGRCAEQYFTGAHQDVVTQSFARISADRLTVLQAELTEQGEWHDVACYVDEDFYMLSLRAGQVEWLQQRLRGLGGLPLYTMRPPLHSAAFAPLRELAEREAFAGIQFADPRIPVVNDHDGRVLRTGDEVRTMLLDATVRPVRWPTVAATLRERGTERVYVAGQDGLWGRVACMTGSFEVTTLTPETALRPRPTAPAGQAAGSIIRNTAAQMAPGVARLPSSSASSTK